MTPVACRVVIERKDSGIVETNFAWAAPYWAQRARVRDVRISLVPVGCDVVLP